MISCCLVSPSEPIEVRRRLDGECGAARNPQRGRRPIEIDRSRANPDRLVNGENSARRERLQFAAMHRRRSACGGDQQHDDHQKNEHLTR